MKERLEYVWDDIVCGCLNQWNCMLDVWHRDDWERAFIWLNPTALFAVPWYFEVLILGRHLGKDEPEEAP